MLELSQYLQTIRQNLRLNGTAEQEIIRELETHIEDDCREMQDRGLSEEEALKESLSLFGSAKIVARQIYEAHNQGTWRQALLAAIPHLFLALLFTINWLVGINWLPIMVVLIGVVAIYGWGHGKPTWLFPWLGYSLLPIAAVGMMLLYLPEGLAWVTLILYIPLTLWLSSFIAIKFIRRDWQYSTLMLLPTFNFVVWFMASEKITGFPDLKLGFLYEYAPWPGLTFLVLAVSGSLFIRLRNRRLKLATLVISGLITLTVIILASNRLGFPAFLGLTVVMLSLLLIPAFVESRVKYRIDKSGSSTIENGGQQY